MDSIIFGLVYDLIGLSVNVDVIAYHSVKQKHFITVKKIF